MKLFFAGSILFFSGVIFGQCPERDVLWKRLVYLRDSSTALPAEKLTELLGYETRIRNCRYQFDSTHALLLQRIGATYFYQADFLKAASYMREAIELINQRAAGGSVNIRHNIRNYYSLGLIYDSLNNVPEKLRSYDSCIALAIRHDSPGFYLANALLIRTIHSYNLGDFHRCISYATICERFSNEYAKRGGESDYWQGSAIALKGLLWKVNALLVLKDYTTAEELLVSKITEYRKTGLKDDFPSIYSQLAEVLLQKSEPAKALHNYQLALKYALNTGYDMGCKVILNNIGYNIYFQRFGDIGQALSYCKKAYHFKNRDISEKISETIETVNILGNIANIYGRKRWYDSAFYYFQLALQQISPANYQLSVTDDLGDQFASKKKLHYLTGLLLDKGDALVSYYKDFRKPESLARAVEVYKTVDRLLSRMQVDQKELDSKLFWRADSKRLYESAINACFMQQNHAEAFYFFEKGRAVLLNDKLKEQRWMNAGDIFEQTQVKRRILKLETELNQAKSITKDYEASKLELFTAKQELERLEQSIKAITPLYYQSFLDTGFITLGQVQNILLQKHQACLEIFSGDTSVFALLVTADNNYLKKINKQDFEQAVSLYIDFLSTPGHINRDFAGFVRTSAHLFDLIFGDMPLPEGRVIISPGGQYFPFESLVAGFKGTAPVYFLENHAVSYTYSARFLMNEFPDDSDVGARTFSGFAPISYPSEFSLATLPGSDRSLRKISSNFVNPVNEISSNASRSKFLQQISQYRVIQLYTHAADSSANNEPVIYFADSALYLSDLISEHKPITRLIVLSACETGTGKVYEGEGVFSFNRGFAALGIPAAITNLWTVDNASTYQLTELFYKWLLKGLPADIALQKAKLEFMRAASKEKSMPCYWAGPVLIGKTDSIELSKPYPWRRIILFLAIGGVVFLAVRQWIISRRMT